jgi:hypothetical protein
MYYNIGIRHELVSRFRLHLGLVLTGLRGTQLTSSIIYTLVKKGIKPEDVKNLPPIEELCKSIPRSSTIEVHSLQRFDNRDIPYSKPLNQCLDEFDNFIVKQDNFNNRVQNHLLENSRAINKLHDIVERTDTSKRYLLSRTLLLLFLL